MGRRSNYERIPKDKYETLDPRAIPPNLVPHIKGKTFYEPSVSSGKLVDMLEAHGAKCVGGSDIQPLGKWDSPENCKDALDITEEDVKYAELIITNPVYRKDWLLPMIEHWSSLRPTWLLLPATFMAVKYAEPYMKKCSRIVNIGRLHWFTNKWVEKEPFDYDDLDKKFDKQVVFYDSMTGTKYYTGYLTPDGKPCKSEHVRGVDDYCFYCFEDYECETIYETRG